MEYCNHKYDKMIEVTPKLVTAISDCVIDVSNHCLAKGLIADDTYDQMLSLEKLSKYKATILVRAVRCAVQINSDCFETFLDVLNVTLPHATKEAVIADLKDRKASTGYRDRCRLTSRQRSIKSKPKSATCSRFNLEKSDLYIRFTGPLATKKFQELHRAFCEALSACKAKNVMALTKKILSMNFSIDYKCISLVHRAKCRAHCKGQLDKALLDCDRVIKLASSLECENGSLITGKALTMKASILRWSERLDEAQGCVERAKSRFFWAAPSSDTAALLYEEVRMKICSAMSENKDINMYIRQVENDYDRIFKHSLCLNAYDRSRLCAFVNARAEVYLRTYYLDDKLPLSTIPTPTDCDLHRAEEILNSYPLNELPTKPHGNRGWHYRNRGDLCMWRKQYSEAIEWAEKAQKQFALANMTHITTAEKRIELYQRLQLQQTKANEKRRKRRLAFDRCCNHIRQFCRSGLVNYSHLRFCRYCQQRFPRHFRRLHHHS